jgi:exonuclease VII large subunit
MDSTAAPINNRKWNLGRLGCNCSPRGIGVPPQKRMGQLGDSVLCPSPVQSQLDSLASQLAQANTDLVDVQNQIVASNQAGLDTRDAAKDLMSQRNDLETMISALTYAYRTFCGTTPPGLSGLGLHSFSRPRARGLGVIPAIPLTTAAVVISALIAAIAIWWEYEQTLKDKIAAQVQQNIATAQQNLQQAVSTGDTNAQQVWSAQLNNLNSQVAGTSWLSKNWPYLAAGGGVLLVLLTD